MIRLGCAPGKPRRHVQRLKQDLLGFSRLCEDHRIRLRYAVCRRLAIMPIRYGNPENRSSGDHAERSGMSYLKLCVDEPRAPRAVG